MTSSDQTAEANWRRFVFFRVLFNSRFYYPVLAVLFLDLGLSATQYTLLNFAWAVAIVLTDVPAGVLADRLGRKPLVVTATVFMVGEMVLLLVAPWHGGVLLFLCCLANRVLSGMAEGMASGADEALVFDSLAERNRSAEWPRVLEQVMRWQSVGMVVAMLVGGATYDPVFMTSLAHGVGWPVTLTQATTLRFPIVLNLATALLALATVAGFREPVAPAKPAAAEKDAAVETTAGAWEHLLAAGRWIAGQPVALFVLGAGLLLDSVIRLFFTFSSSYFRLIALPAATYGLIGAGLGALGLVASPLARRLVARFSLLSNYALVAGVAVLSLAGLAGQWPIWSVLFVVPLGVAMYLLGFMVSYYLNALVDSHRRATVLSFKGLAFNLGYGFAGLLFALVLRADEDDARPDRALAEGFRLLPLWLLLTLAVLTVAFWRRRAALRRHG